MIPSILLAPLERILNQYVRLDADALDRLTDYQGKTLLIEWLSPELQMVLSVQAEGISLNADLANKPDACITTTPAVFIRELTHIGQDNAQSPRPLHEHPDITVTGDKVFAQALWNILWRLQIDWEEQLARFIGDIPAHQIGNWWRELQAFGQTAFNTLLTNASEYLHYESHQLPPPHAIGEFVKTVDQLQTHVEQLEKRIKHLQNCLIIV